MIIKIVNHFRLLIVGAGAVALFFFVFAQKIQADICAPIAPNPVGSVEAWSNVTVGYDLSEDPHAIQVCGNGVNTNCYKIRYCWGRILQGCANGFFLDATNMSVSGKTITAVIPDAEVAADYWLTAGDQQICPSSKIAINPARCDEGAFQVVGRSHLFNYTIHDELLLRFNGANTHNFSQGFYDLFVIKPDGSSYQVGSDALKSTIDSRSSLRYGWQGSVEAEESIGVQNMLGTYRVVVTDGGGGTHKYCDNFTFTVTLDGDNDNGVGVTPGQDQASFNLCQQAGDEVNVGRCNTCFHNNGIWTAVGCIPFNSSVGMIRVFITIGLGIAGGVVVLMVLAGSFLLSTSQGDLKRVDEAKGLIGSAVIGLLFVIFSVTILRFIGVDILQIPGLGGI